MFLEPTRKLFCPQNYQEFVYADTQLPLAHEQIMLTPLEESLILQSSKIKTNDMILEIGTGSGFFSYLLSKLCQKVVSIDYYSDFIEQAQQRFQELKINNIDCLQQDASTNIKLPHQFDMIICSAGIESIPQAWLQHLKNEGKIFAPIGRVTQNAQWTHYQNASVVGHEFVFQTKVPMLIDKQPEKFVF
jgi:protein-L-isoaspartate(D-aspartate) O-methyltransferase